MENGVEHLDSGYIMKVEQYVLLQDWLYHIRTARSSVTSKFLT